MSDLVGDIEYLHKTRIEFSAVHSVRASELKGSFLLASVAGFAKVAASRAKVNIVSDSLKCDIIGPASPSAATVGAVAVVPKSVEETPNSIGGVLSIGGSVYCVHSLYQAPVQQPLRFAAEVSHLIKPVPQVGEAPRVVYCIEVEGGTQSTKVLIRVQGVVEVDGVGFINTW